MVSRTVRLGKLLGYLACCAIAMAGLVVGPSWAGIGECNELLRKARSVDEAIAKLRSSVESGDLQAQLCYGILLVGGKGAPKNGQEGVRLIQEVAETGDADAQYTLGSLYWDGKYVKGNYIEAVQWFRLAAEQRHTPAQMRLAQAYRSGLGVHKNLEAADQWYQKAVDGGDAKALYRLGENALKGTGVPNDEVKALMWFILAAEGDAHGWDAGAVTRAGMRKIVLSRKLAPTQVAQAEAMARDWKANRGN